MPLVKCTKDGKSGWKVHNVNKCWTGPDAKKKAIRQWIAIKGPKEFKQEMQHGSDKDIILDILNSEKDLSTTEIESLMIVAELTVPEVMKVFETRATL